MVNNYGKFEIITRSQTRYKAHLHYIQIKKISNTECTDIIKAYSRCRKPSGRTYVCKYMI